MATKINGKVEREVQSYRYGALIVRMTPEGVYTKEKGRRTWVGPVGWGSIHEKAAAMKAESDRKERELNRKVRKVSRGLLTT